MLANENSSAGGALSSLESEPQVGRPLLSVDDLVTVFPTRRGDFRAVDAVSFKVTEGETVCLVGESGSGKSVTARSILQIVDRPGRIESGRILLHPAKKGDALDIAALSPGSRMMRGIRGRDIAMIFQEPMSALSPVHSIGNQIVEAIRLHESIGKRAARARAIDLLRLVEIREPEKAIDRYAFEYSGGMRQRAMIAIALACNPRLLIADEPTTALDVTIQAEILKLIKRIQIERGMGVLFITHDMGVVAAIADRVVVMQKGRVVEQGSVDHIFERARHPYARMLVDTAQRLFKGWNAKEIRVRESRALGETLLAVKELRVAYSVASRSIFRRSEPFFAVDGVSFELCAGESLGIVGESGSGKTTLGRALLGAVAATGEASYRGGSNPVDLLSLDKRGWRDLRKDIRFVFQDPFGSLNPRMTVAQIIGEPLLNYGIASGAALKDRVASLLEMVELKPNMMERYPHAFSGGERQRIGIARALALDPKLIIADEPTSALDVSVRAQVLDLLLALRERLGLSFVFISHDIGVVRYFCDRIAVMNRGKIVEIGSARKICENPMQAYTQELISAVPKPDLSVRRLR